MPIQTKPYDSQSSAFGALDLPAQQRRPRRADGPSPYRHSDECGFDERESSVERALHRKKDTGTFGLCH